MGLSLLGVGWFKTTEPGPHARSPVLPGSSSCFLPSPADLGTPSPPLTSPISANGTLSLVVSNLPGEDVTDSPRTNPSPPVRTCCPTKVGAPEEDLNCVAPPPLTLTPSTLLLGSVGFTELVGISSSLASFLSPTTCAGDTATLHCLYLALPVPTPASLSDFLGARATSWFGTQLPWAQDHIPGPLALLLRYQILPDTPHYLHTISIS